MYFNWRKHQFVHMYDFIRTCNMGHVGITSSKIMWWCKTTSQAFVWINPVKKKTK